MTTTGYERPSEADEPDEERVVTTYHWQGSRALDDNEHGEAGRVYTHATMEALNHHLHQDGSEWDEVTVWKVTTTNGRPGPRQYLMTYNEGEQPASREVALAHIRQIRVGIAKAGNAMSLDRALANPAIGTRPPARKVVGKTGYDARIPGLDYSAIYDSDGVPHPHIVLDNHGNPRTDVVYDGDVPFNAKGERITVDNYGREVQS
jgi:hypothetical protein